VRFHPSGLVKPAIGLPKWTMLSAWLTRGMTRRQWRARETTLNEHTPDTLDPGLSADSGTAPFESALRLPPIVGVAAAAELQQSMLSALERSADVLCIDSSAVQRIDTAGVQLLLALCNRALAADKDVQWQGDTGLLRQAAAALGLEHLLPFPEGEAG